jgi:hypothetical protein
MIDFLPIEQLPEGIMALLRAGSRYFYGYILRDKIYRFTNEPYNGIVSPFEFRRLTEYEEKNLGRYHE